MLKNKLQTDKNFEDDSISFSDIVLSIARQIKTIFLIFFLSIIISLIHIYFFTSPLYVSTSKIMSSSGGSNFSQAAGLAAQFGIGGIEASSGEHKWNYLEILKSRTVAKVLLKKRFDTDEFGKNKTLLQILTYGNQEPELSNDEYEIHAVDALIDMINASENISTGTYAVNIGAPEAELAFSINQALIEELDNYQKEYNKMQTYEARKFIDERINQTKVELQDIEDALKTFMDRNRRIENSPALQLEQQRLSREVSVLTGVFTTLRQQLETTKIEEVKVSDYVIVLDPPEVPLLRSKPQKKKIVLIYVIFGMLLGLIIAFIKDYFKVNTGEDIIKLKNALELLKKNISEMFMVFVK